MLPTKILVLWAFFRPDPWGPALASRGEALAKYLAREGHEVSVFAPDYGSVGPSPCESVQRVQLWESLRHRFGLACAIVKYPGSFLRVLSLIRKLNPDVVIASQPTFTLPIQSILLAHIVDARFVVDMQDIFVQFQEFYPGRRRGKVRLVLERIALSEADRIVSVLPAMQEVAQSAYGIPSSRFYLLYNGFDSERHTSGSRGWEQRDIDLLHLGAPREYYRTEFLIGAFEILLRRRPNTELIFTDFIGTPYQERIRELVITKGLENSIKLLGPQSEETVKGMLTRAKLGVYTLYQRPSSRVVVGTKTFEYLSAGLPIAFLGPQEGEMARLIREHGGGFSASDRNEWADLAHRVLSERATWETMSEKALGVASQYDWKNTIPAFSRTGLEPLRKASA